jgi:hypothetical protein
MPNRRSAAAHLLGARQFRDALAITSPPSLTIAVVVGVQAVIRRGIRVHPHFRC